MSSAAQEYPETWRNVLLVELSEAERKFEKGSAQVEILAACIKDLFVRYDRAREEDTELYVKHIRRRIEMYECMQLQYYHYVEKQSQDIRHLRGELFGEIVDIIDNDEYYSDNSTTRASVSRAS